MRVVWLRCIDVVRGREQEAVVNGGGATCVDMVPTLLHNVGVHGTNTVTLTSLHRNDQVPARRCKGTVHIHCRDGRVPTHGRHGLALEEEGE